MLLKETVQIEVLGHFSYPLMSTRQAAAEAELLRVSARKVFETPFNSCLQDEHFINFVKLQRCE